MLRIYETKQSGQGEVLCFFIVVSNECEWWFQEGRLPAYLSISCRNFFLGPRACMYGLACTGCRSVRWEDVASAGASEAYTNFARAAWLGIVPATVLTVR